jgi:hypothetical protein
MAAAVSDMEKLIKASPVPLAGGLGKGKPKITTGKSVVFNGVEKDGNDHETFSFPDDGGRNFCKTAQKPYDLVVVACLAAAKDRLGPLLEVSSDGDPDEWEEGVAFASKVLERVIANPITE